MILHRKKNAGSALVLLMGITVVLALLVGVAVTTTQFQARITQRNRTQLTAIEAADGALEMLFSGWRKICSTSTAEAPATQAFDAEIPLPITSGSNAYFPNLPNLTVTRSYQANPAPMTLSNYRVQAVTPLLDTAGTGADPDLSTLAISASPAQSTGPGTGTYSYYYLASADVTLPNVNGKSLTAKVRRVFEKRVTSPWNWAVFFNDNLEISPNSALTLNGWVHTNGNLYTGSNQLTVTDRMTYVGDWSVGWAPGDGYHTTLLLFPQAATAPNTPTDLPPGNDQTYLPFGWYLNSYFNTTDTNTNNDGYHEIIERPTSAETDALSTQRFYNQADVKILIDASNNLTIMKKNGTVVTASSTGADLTLYNNFRAAITTNRSFQDNREQANVRVADVDVSVIRARYPSTGSSFNGVIYIADTSASQTGGTPKRGIRLINGTSLPTGGLTVVSENPIYIKGDYNTGGNAPPSNTGDPTDPTVSGYTAQPAAIIADAVTLMSRSFSDSNSGGSLSNRPAVNTTVNAALLAGIVPTGTNGSNYSGGAENFIRLLEDWTGRSLTYYGSMVQFYLSKQGTGVWGGANVYRPGTLNFYFDSNLLTSSPPGTATTVAYLQQQRWFMVY